MDNGERTSSTERENAGTAELSLRNARRQTPGMVKSNRRLADAAGISERHLYRLMKKDAAKSAGAQRLYEQMVGSVLAGDILSQLGHKDLVGTGAHGFLDKFVPLLAQALADLHAEDPGAIDTDLAERIAAQTIERLRGWHLRTNDVELRVRGHRPPFG